MKSESKEKQKSCFFSMWYITALLIHTGEKDNGKYNKQNLCVHKQTNSDI